MEDPVFIITLACQLAILITTISAWKRFRSWLAAFFISGYVVTAMWRLVLLSAGHFSELVYCLSWVFLMLGVWIHLSTISAEKGVPK